MQENNFFLIVKFPSIPCLQVLKTPVFNCGAFMIAIADTGCLTVSKYVNECRCLVVRGVNPHLLTIVVHAPCSTQYVVRYV